MFFLACLGQGVCHIHLLMPWITDDEQAQPCMKVLG